MSSTVQVKEVGLGKSRCKQVVAKLGVGLVAAAMGGTVNVNKKGGAD